MRTHTTTSNSWHLVPKLNTSFNTMKKDFTTTIEGCPYDINMEVVLTLTELADMGFNHNSEEEIAYDLGANECEKEMQVNFKLWDCIAALNRVMNENDTTGWTVAQWDEACPFLFECDPFLEDEENLQEVRDSWD